MSAFTLINQQTDPATQVKNHRLAKARLQLIDGENKLGIVSTDALNGKVWHLGNELGNKNRFLIEVLQTLPETAPWIGMLGLNDFGWVAAAEAGIDLEKLLLVTPPVAQAEEVLAELVDGFDVTVCGQVFLSSRGKTRLAAKVKKRRNLLLTFDPWVGISRQWQLTTSRIKRQQVG
ncbi:MAG: hypothetical protein Q4D73_05290 [Actinomycetaceae bacterium]|nr:hypothetical protein [Actinomycetaceae bacterium]